ncbi:MAG: MBOAT family protein, partial [Eubacteriales bacterium]
MLLSILSGYLHGLWIDYKRNTAYAKVALISSIVVSGGFLVFFKYTNFFIKNINHILSVKIPPLAIV